MRSTSAEMVCCSRLVCRKVTVVPPIGGPVARYSSPVRPSVIYGL